MVFRATIVGKDAHDMAVLFKLRESLDRRSERAAYSTGAGDQKHGGIENAGYFSRTAGRRGWQCSIEQSHHTFDNGDARLGSFFS
jgi:hypothetical protein